MCLQVAIFLNLFVFLFLPSLYPTIINAAVFKPGVKAPISIDQLNTSFGQNYMKRSFFKLIFPGTKWCGDGDIAENYNDLGLFTETDTCCRTHDYCDDYLFAGQSKHTLVNNNKFTRLNCKCDLQFYECLTKVTKDTISSKLIGITYFDFVGPQCYSLQPPATCTEYKSIVGLNKRCTVYKFDETKAKQWQWFDVPRWTSSVDIANEMIIYGKAQELALLRYLLKSADLPTLYEK